MEVAYYTVSHSIRRRNNVIDLAEYRSKLQKEQTPEPALSVEHHPERWEEPGIWEKAVQIMDIIASAALTVSAVVAMCVAVFVLV